jgi:hypothetical protein
LTKNAENDTNGTSVMEGNQTTTNIIEKKNVVRTGKLIICEIVFVDSPPGVLTSL